MYSDIWILTTHQEDVPTLEKLSKISSPICCWKETAEDTGGLQDHHEEHWHLREHLTGFVRMIDYAVKAKDHDDVDYAYLLYEGQMDKGNFKGFGRVINSIKDSE